MNMSSGDDYKKTKCHMSIKVSEDKSFNSRELDIIKKKRNYGHQQQQIGVSGVTKKYIKLKRVQTSHQIAGVSRKTEILLKNETIRQNLYFF